MKLVKMEIADYINALSSKSPAPGGGSASALAGAQGLALMAMVCNLTIGREKYKDTEADCKKALIEINRLIEKMCTAIDKDTDAYNAVSSAYKLPKEDPARAKTIEEAMLLATKVPLETMKLGLEGIRQLLFINGKTNKSAQSDLGVALLNLNACIKGAWLNVEINLPSLSDETIKAEFLKEAEAILKEAEKAKL